MNPSVQLAFAFLGYNPTPSLDSLPSARRSCGKPTSLNFHAFLLTLVAATFTCRVLAAPILAPDLQYCHLPLKLPDAETEFDCCAPQWDRPALDFQINESAQYSSLKVRKPAHSLDDEYAEKINRAYALMKALPPEDPRSFGQQANIHCAYCCAVYQMGNSSTPLQVHGSWLFFPFHRWYLYFHERILAHLLGDDGFALPFWNYDHPNGSTIPEVYIRYPELTDRFRERRHLPPSVAMVDYKLMNYTFRTAEEQIAANLDTMYGVVVGMATTPYLFFGQPYRKDDGPMPGYGTVERMPHNSVHVWTGDLKQIGKKDMGTLYAAARDPVFYPHHANLDRFWEVWKNQGNEDIQDPDYLDSEFVFYNENAELVKVKVRDCLSTEKLGYIYEPVDDLWLNVTTTARRVSTGVADISEAARLCSAGETLTEPCSAVVSRERQAALEGEEMLVIEGIEGKLESPALFEVFVNFPEANGTTMINCTEFAGRFSTMAQAVVTNSTGNYLNASAHFGISFIIRELNLSKEASVVVTLVPSVETPYHPVTISSIKIEYESVGVGTSHSAM